MKATEPAPATAGEEQGEPMNTPNGLLGQLGDLWKRPSMVYIPVFLCALYETMMVTRLLLLPRLANPTLASRISGTHWGLPLFLALLVLTLALLCLRRSRPGWTLLGISGLVFLTALCYGSAMVYPLIPWLVALYTDMVEAATLRSLAASLLPSLVLVVLALALASLWHKEWDLPSLLYPMGFFSLLVMGLGLISRMLHERRRSERSLQEEQERNLALAQQRDQALTQSRIAAELHDSVGHDLTAIISLSEGLDQATGQPQVDEAITLINDLARQGLTDTRTAVKALDSSDLQTRESTPGRDVGPHGWEDIGPVLDHARQAGLAVALTETGHRSATGPLSDLCFSLTREAVTNAMRHGRGVDRIVISWDHDAQGGVAISIRDNGRADLVQAGGGTGLNRLSARVEAAGGTLSAGFSDTGWTLSAQLPALPGQDEKVTLA
ncbi:sensor histidine kinase [Bifidobacterium aemilianum]|nr:histidine kinase [Bifidobacterium aemilianum]